MRQIIFATLLWGCLNGFTSAAVLCPEDIRDLPSHRGDVVVYSPQTQFTVFRSVNREDLTKEAMKIRPGDTDGLTLLDYEQRVSVSFLKEESGCLAPQIQVMLGAARAAVYIALEVPADSCRFQAVYAHEMKHAKAAQRVFDTTALQLKKQAQAWLNTPELAQLISQTERPETEIKPVLEQMAATAIRRALTRLDGENKLIDGEGEAERMAERCAPPAAPVLQVGTDLR